MNDDPQISSFTRKGSTWFGLLMATVLWVCVCIWAWFQFGFSFADLKTLRSPTAQTAQLPPAVSDEALGPDQNLTQTQEDAVSVSQESVDEPSVLAANNQEPSISEPVTDSIIDKPGSDSDVQASASLDAQDKARLTVQARTRAAEQARLEAEEDALEAARLAEQKRVQEQERVKAELEAQAQAKAQEQARLEAEERALEAARLAELQRLQEQERVKAELEAQEQARVLARLAAEERARSAEAVRAASEAQAKEEARLAELALLEQQRRVQAQLNAEKEARLAAEAEAKAAQALAEEQRIEAENLIQREAEALAAAEAARIAAIARRQREYQALRLEELSVLSGLSARLRFAPRSNLISRDMERALDRMFEPLYLYSEVEVLVTVSTNEFSGAASDNVLSRERGREVVSYLISRGLEEKRFQVRIEAGEGLPYGSHRVSVTSEDVLQ
ncbi:MAG: hypothetical protein AB8B79_08265 [Granulosicoccus sp.]